MTLLYWNLSFISPHFTTSNIYFPCCINHVFSNVKVNEGILLKNFFCCTSLAINPTLYHCSSHIYESIIFHSQLSVLIEKYKQYFNISFSFKIKKWISTLVTLYINLLLRYGINLKMKPLSNSTKYLTAAARPSWFTRSHVYLLVSSGIQ